MQQEQNPQQDQRTLASIMFTDVVGFSKLTAINEERTMRALHRDFDLMFRSVASHNGEVLNTMGDGMMVYFPSAVQCMQCALEIQQTMHALKQSNPPDGILSHRIGLNIGDIHLNGRNTMGDGVNQAARIQSMAKPDSIKMSAEFHKLVKDKVKMDARYVPGQMAKNIPAPIPTYEVPAIDEQLKIQAAEALFTPPTQADGGATATGRRAILLLLLTIALIAIAMIPVYILTSAKASAKDGGIQVPKGSGLKQAQQNWRDRMKKNETSDANAPSEANTPAPSETAKFALTMDELAQIEKDRDAYNFAAVVSLLKAHPGIESPEGQALLKKYEDLVNLKIWLDSEVAATTAQKPLSFTSEGQQASIYTSAGSIIIATNGQESPPKGLWELKPASIKGIAESAVALPPTGTAAPATAITWIATFVEIFRLTQ